jgi:hypothetical protein
MGGAALRTLLPDSAIAQQALLGSIAIPAPLMLPAMQPGAPTLIQCTVGANAGQLEITSLTASGSKAVHVSGTALTLLPAAQPPRRTTFGRRLGAAVLPALPLAAAKPAAVGALEIEGARPGFWMDPAPFDCFLQLGQVLMGGDNTEVFVPAGLGALRVAAKLGSADAAWATVLPVGREGAPVSDFQLDSGAATLLCSISGLLAKSMGRVQPALAAAKVAAVAPVDCLYEVAWQAMDGSWDILPAESSSLWQLPASQQQQPQPAAVAASAIAAVQRLLQSAAAGSAAQLQTVQAALLPFLPPHGSSTRTAAAALSGLVRTLNQECPQISWSAMDVDSHATASNPHAAARLVQLQASSAEVDSFGLATRGNTRFGPSLLKSLAQEELGAYHLMPMPRGSLNSLVPLPVDAGCPLGPDQILLAVKSVGLNFRDVLNVLGMYPGDPGPPGGDCSGIVLRGSVTHNGAVIAGPGDAVFGLAAGSLGSHVVTSSKTMVPMPASVGFEEAATMPTVFITVDTALKGIAALQPGQRVLVHAAAGGVGLAAMQVRLGTLGFETWVPARSNSPAVHVDSWTATLQGNCWEGRPPSLARHVPVQLVCCFS